MLIKNNNLDKTLRQKENKKLFVPPVDFGQTVRVLSPGCLRRYAFSWKKDREETNSPPNRSLDRYWLRPRRVAARRRAGSRRGPIAQEERRDDLISHVLLSSYTPIRSFCHACTSCRFYAPSYATYGPHMADRRRDISAVFISYLILILHVDRREGSIYHPKIIQCLLQ